MKLNNNFEFNGLQSYSKETGLSKEKLVEAFNIENSFHNKLKNQQSYNLREALYKEFYHKLLNFYERLSIEDDSILKKISLKDNHVKLFSKELFNKSIIDFGCGEGLFLRNIKKNIKHKDLVGVDIFIPKNLREIKKIRFISSSIINFKTKKKFDVAFSDNVMEHISVLDYNDHLTSIYNSLKPGGIFILIMPNRLFGPSDITRIIDNSSTGQTSAKGGHLNESTYTEMINWLTKVGFINFKTVFPIPYIKHFSFFRFFRIKTNWIRKIEKNNLMLKLFRSLKYKGRCQIRFTITLICQKPVN